MAVRLGAFRGLPGSLWGIVAAAFALRLALLPFMHPWDGNTFHNLFAQLAQNQNPYATFWDLTLEARSRWHVGASSWYEYFAYPPLLIYLYWPLAHVASWFAPLAPTFYASVQGVVVPNEFPLAFLVLFKLPIWAADFAIAGMLWWRLRSVAAVALYLLNPLVLVVSGAWMFDAIPAALTLAALLAFERERFAWSGALLGFGFLAKIYPLFLLPVFFLALVWRRDARAFRLVGAFVGVSVLLMLPFLPEILHTFTFNDGRSGGGLSLHQVVLSWLIFQDVNLLRFELLQSPLVGSIVLFAALGVTYVVLDRVRPRLHHAMIVTLLVFLLATKVVNEQYVLWLLPFLAIALAERATTARRVAFHLLWLVPFAFMLVHVPVTAFWPGGLPVTERLISDHLMVAAAGAVAAVAFAASAMFALWAYWPRPSAVVEEVRA